MKLLLDENLSPSGEPVKVAFSGIDACARSWADFVALARRYGWRPKVIHLKQGDLRLRLIEGGLRRTAVRISQGVKNEQSGLLSLRFMSSENLRGY